MAMRPYSCTSSEFLICIRFWTVKKLVNQIFDSTSVAMIFQIAKRGRIIGLTTAMFLSIQFVATAETTPPVKSSPTIRDSQILPYLLDNPNENLLVRVRCSPTDRHEIERKRQIIREQLLQSNYGHRNYTVTIELEASCHNLQIHIPDDSDFSDVPVSHPYFNSDRTQLHDSWLTRKGSGWYWLLRPR